MKILAIDTSCLVLSVSVMEDEKILAERMINFKKNHSETLMPNIVELLKELDFTYLDIDAFAVSIGPGSFTGLRIGVTAIKSICFASNKPIIAIPTLDALAYNISTTDSLVCPIMDARNNQVFTSIYKYENGIQKRLIEYSGIEISKLLNILEKYDSSITFLGDACLIHKQYLNDRLHEKCIIANPNLMFQRASSVAALAYKKALEKKFDNVFTLVPFYLRKSQAERKLEEKLEEN